MRHLRLKCNFHALFKPPNHALYFCVQILRATLVAKDNFHALMPRHQALALIRTCIPPCCCWQQIIGFRLDLILQRKLLVLPSFLPFEFISLIILKSCKMRELLSLLTLLFYSVKLSYSSGVNQSTGIRIMHSLAKVWYKISAAMHACIYTAE